MPVFSQHGWDCLCKPAHTPPEQVMGHEVLYGSLHINFQTQSRALNHIIASVMLNTCGLVVVCAHFGVRDAHLPSSDNTNQCSQEQRE